MIRGVAGCVRPVGSKLRFTIPVINLTLEGLIFEGCSAQRPYYVRLLGYFDAKGKATALSNLGGMFRIVGPGDATSKETAVMVPTLRVRATRILLFSCRNRPKTLDPTTALSPRNPKPDTRKPQRPYP